MKKLNKKFANYLIIRSIMNHEIFNSYNFPIFLINITYITKNDKIIVYKLLNYI